MQAVPQYHEAWTENQNRAGSFAELMSNALFSIYGRPTSSPWFPRLCQLRCTHPDADFLALDRQYPCESAIYFLCLNRGISYIGISGTRSDGGLFRRLRQHWRNPRKAFDFVYAFGLPTTCLDEWEKSAIANFRPEANFSGRNLYAKVNDELDGLSAFVQQRNYSQDFDQLRRFRIDVGCEREPSYYSVASAPV